jgi:hypothetical protein
LNDFKNIANENVDFYNKILHKYKSENVKHQAIMLKKKKLNEEIMNFKAEREKAKQIKQHNNSITKTELNHKEIENHQINIFKESSQFTFLNSNSPVKLQFRGNRKDSIFQTFMNKLKSPNENESIKKSSPVKNNDIEDQFSANNINISEISKLKKKIDGNGNHIDSTLPKIKIKTKHTEIFRFSDSSVSNANEVFSNRDQSNNTLIYNKKDQNEIVNIKNQEFNINKPEINLYEKPKISSK